MSRTRRTTGGAEVVRMWVPGIGYLRVFLGLRCRTGIGSAFGTDSHSRRVLVAENLEFVVCAPVLAAGALESVVFVTESAGVLGDAVSGAAAPHRSVLEHGFVVGYGPVAGLADAAIAVP